MWEFILEWAYYISAVNNTGKRKYVSFCYTETNLEIATVALNKAHSTISSIFMGTVRIWGHKTEINSLSQLQFPFFLILVTTV